jgi:hypothetical protein
MTSPSQPTTLTAMQKVYALLWREMRVSDKPYVREARAILLASLSNDKHRDAIEWVLRKYPVTENEIALQPGAGSEE